MPSQHSQSAFLLPGITSSPLENPHTRILRIPDSHFQFFDDQDQPRKGLSVLPLYRQGSTTYAAYLSKDRGFLLAQTLFDIADKEAGISGTYTIELFGDDAHLVPVPYPIEYREATRVPLRVSPHELLLTDETLMPLFAPLDPLHTHPLHLAYRRKGDLWVASFSIDRHNRRELFHASAKEMVPTLEDRLGRVLLGAVRTGDATQAGKTDRAPRVRRKLADPAATKDDAKEPTTGDAAPAAVQPLVPRQVKEYLDQHIIGQEHVKRDLSVIAANYTRGTVRHALLIGPTGVGKTACVETLSGLLKIPYRSVRLPNVTRAGYVGEDLYSPLLSLARELKTNTPAGILFLDELDKIVDPDDFVGGDGVQNQLLGLLEGKPFEPQVNPRTLQQGQFTPELIYPSKILVLLAGAFSDRRKGPSLARIVQERLRRARPAIGFGSTEQPIDASIARVQPEDLFAYGIKPELVGRIPNILQLHHLDRDELRRILTKKKGNHLDDYRGMLISGWSRDLVVEPDAVEAILDALPAGTGARSLDTVCQRVFKPIFYDLDRYTKGATVALTGAIVRDLLARDDDNATLTLPR